MDEGRTVAVDGRVEVGTGVVALVGLGESTGVEVPVGLGEGAGVEVLVGVCDGVSVSVSSIGAWALIVVPEVRCPLELACAGVI